MITLIRETDSGREREKESRVLCLNHYHRVFGPVERGHETNGDSRVMGRVGVARRGAARRGSPCLSSDTSCLMYLSNESLLKSGLPQATPATSILARAAKDARRLVCVCVCVWECQRASV